MSNETRYSRHVTETSNRYRVSIEWKRNRLFPKQYFRFGESRGNL